MGADESHHLDGLPESHLLRDHATAHTAQPVLVLQLACESPADRLLLVRIERAVEGARVDGRRAADWSWRDGCVQIQQLCGRIRLADALSHARRAESVIGSIHRGFWEGPI